MTVSRCGSNSPSTTCRSVRHTPQMRTRRRISCGPGCGSGRSRSANGLVSTGAGRLRTMAFMTSHSRQVAGAWQPLLTSQGGKEEKRKQFASENRRLTAPRLVLSTGGKITAADRPPPTLRLRSARCGYVEPMNRLDWRASLRASRGAHGRRLGQSLAVHDRLRSLVGARPGARSSPSTALSAGYARNPSSLSWKGLCTRGPVGGSVIPAKAGIQVGRGARIWIPAFEAVDFRRDDRCLPLEKGGKEGFWNGSFGQIPLNPPFSKGEDSDPERETSLSTASFAGMTS